MASGSQSLGTGYNNASVQGLSLISGATGGSPQGIYEESSTQEYPIGQLREFEDGRCFRYSSFAAATAAGLLVSTDVSATCVAKTNNIAAVAAIGATEVVLTDAGVLGSATKNQYAGAILHAAGDSGEGYQYKIKSSTAASSNAVTFTLYDGLVIALSVSSDVAITGSLYNGVVTATHGTDPILAGVTTRVMQSGYYGWIQTAGVATILCEDTPDVGDNLTLGDTAAGSVQKKDAETEPAVGIATYTGVATEHVGVLLTDISR